MVLALNKIVFHRIGRKILIASVILLFTTLIANAQKDFIPVMELNTSSNTTNYKIPGKQFYPKYIPSGSDFYNDAWCNGYIILENGDRYDDLYLKYNTLKDELITLNGRTNILIMVDKDAVSEFGLFEKEKQITRFKKYYFDKVPKGEHYFNVLYEGKLRLLIWQRAFEEITASYKDKNGALQIRKYVLRPQFFVCFPNGHFEQFKFKRYSFLKLFPEEKKEIRRLLRKHKNHMQTYPDYIHAVQLIETEYYFH